MGGTAVHKRFRGDVQPCRWDNYILLQLFPARLMSEAHLPLESGPRDQPAACHFKGQRLRAYIGSVVGIVGYPKPKSRCRWLLSLESSTIRPGFSDQECDADEAVRAASVVSGASACRENGSGRVPGRGGHLVQRKSRKSTENVM